MRQLAQWISSVVLIVLIGSTCTGLLATTYWVSTSGSDQNGDGSEGNPWAHVYYGVSHDKTGSVCAVLSQLSNKWCLQPGDTLIIKAGTYEDNLNFVPGGTSWNAPVTIKAAPGEQVILRPPNTNFQNVIGLRLDGSRAHPTEEHYIIIDGLNLDGANVAYDIIGIADGAGHIRIQNGSVYGSPVTGSRANCVGSAGDGTGNTGYNEFINLEIHDCGPKRDPGNSNWCASGCVDFPTNCTDPQIASYLHGMYIGSYGDVIDHCRVHDNSGFGLHLYGADASANNVARFNTVYNNACGCGIVLANYGGLIAHDNVVFGNKSCGIRVDDSNDQVYDNVCYDNAEGGILVGYMGGTDVEHSVISGNICYGNGVGDLVFGGNQQNSTSLLNFPRIQP